MNKRSVDSIVIGVLAWSSTFALLWLFMLNLVPVTGVTVLAWIFFFLAAFLPSLVRWLEKQ